MSYIDKNDLNYIEKLANERREEINRLNELVDNFTRYMKAKLHQKVNQGYKGWDIEGNEQVIIDSLVNHVRKLDKGDKSQAVDIANLAAFIWNLDKN